jgi:hypothetical protein
VSQVEVPILRDPFLGHVPKATFFRLSPTVH